LVVVFKGGRGPELKGTISKAIDALIVVDDIEGGRDEVERSDVKSVVDWLLRLRIYFPQHTDHPMEIELPGPSERDRDIEEVSPTQVQFIQKIILVDSDSQILLP
jgi:hypothetical protein